MTNIPKFNETIDRDNTLVSDRIEACATGARNALIAIHAAVQEAMPFGSDTSPAGYDGTVTVLVERAQQFIQYLEDDTFDATEIALYTLGGHLYRISAEGGIPLSDITETIITRALTELTGAAHILQGDNINIIEEIRLLARDRGDVFNQYLAIRSEVLPYSQNKGIAVNAPES